MCSRHKARERGLVLPLVLLMLTVTGLIATAGMQRAAMHVSMMRSLSLQVQLEDGLAAAIGQSRTQILSALEQPGFAAASMDYPLASADSWREFDRHQTQAVIQNSSLMAGFFIERLHTAQHDCCHLRVNARAAQTGDGAALFGQSVFALHLATTSSQVQTTTTEYHVFSQTNSLLTP